MPENENTSIHKYYIYNALKEDTSDKEIVCLIIDKGEGKGIYQSRYLIPSPEIAGDKRGEIIECLKNLKKDRKLSKDQKSLFRVVYMCNSDRGKIANRYRSTFYDVTNDLEDGKLITEFDKREEKIEGLTGLANARDLAQKAQEAKEKRKKERDENGTVYKLINLEQTSEEGKKLSEKIGKDSGGKVKTYSKKFIEDKTHPIILINECRNGVDKIIELRVYKILKELVGTESLEKYLNKLDWTNLKLKTIDKDKPCFTIEEKKIDKLPGKMRFKIFLKMNAKKADIR